MNGIHGRLRCARTHDVDDNDVNIWTSHRGDKHHNSGDGDGDRA